MESLLFADTLKLALHVSKYFLILLAVGSILGNFLRASLQLEDHILSFVGKYIFLALTLYFFSSGLFNEILNFTLRIWSGMDFYI